MLTSSTAYEDRCALFNHEVYSKPFHGFAIAVPRRIAFTVTRSVPSQVTARAIQLAIVNSTASESVTGRAAALDAAPRPRR